MAENDALCDFLNDLIETLHLQAKEIERITTQLEQQTAPLHPPSEMPVVVSTLSELHSRVKRFREGS
jgi:hypothetical protein